MGSCFTQSSCKNIQGYKHQSTPTTIEASCKFSDYALMKKSMACEETALGRTFRFATLLRQVEEEKEEAKRQKCNEVQKNPPQPKLGSDTPITIKNMIIEFEDRQQRA